MPAPPPHDALFKAAFGQADLARSELELVLPAEIKVRLDLASLEPCPVSFVDDELRRAHADLLYRVNVRNGGDALLYVLFEHQSTFDPRMPLRLLRYMVSVWERWERDHPKAKLPIVIPVVLSHEPGGWRAAPEFSSLLDADPDLLAAAGPFQPLFRFVLDDLHAISLDALASRGVHDLALLVQLAFWSARSLSRLELAAPAIGGRLWRSCGATTERGAFGTALRVPSGRCPAGRGRRLGPRYPEQVAGPEGRPLRKRTSSQTTTRAERDALTRGKFAGVADCD